MPALSTILHFRNKLVQQLFTKVDNSPLVVFRIIFGCVIIAQAYLDIRFGIIKYEFIAPKVTFPYIGLEWLQPLPGIGMYVYFTILGLTGFMIMFGWFYRPAIISFTILWTIAFLMQKTLYNNHYYLMILLSGLMIFMPANAGYSVDAYRNKGKYEPWCRQWMIWILMAQVAIVYLFGAYNKLYPDWLSGRYIHTVFVKKSYIPVLKHLYAKRWFELFITYGGIFFDLLIAPMLLWRKTRPLAFVFTCMFAAFNFITFRIGIFPLLTIGLCVLYFDAATIRRVILRNKTPFSITQQQETISAGRQRIIALSLGVYMLLQLLLPLRYLLYPDNTLWTEEGNRFSWRMMLRKKQGTVAFKIIDKKNGEAHYLYPGEVLNDYDAHYIPISPDMMWQFSRYIKQTEEAKGTSVKVYAVTSVSLNDHTAQPLVDSTVDLASVPWHFIGHNPWITPYNSGN